MDAPSPPPETVMEEMVRPVTGSSKVAVTISVAVFTYCTPSWIEPTPMVIATCRVA